MIQEMNSVVATVSGYHGSERLKLIKLIELAGANYVGKMSRSTTHLVCWEFEGRKYDLAKKFGTIILNHRWLEECVKEGKRIPEHPYTQKSGKKVGLIILDLPVLRETPVLLAENKLLLNKPSIRDRLKDVIDLDSDEIENDGWDVDCLLDENLYPKPGSSETASRRSKRKVGKGTTKEDWRAKANNRRSVCDLQGRSDNGRSMWNDLAESSHRSWRLVGKKMKRDVIESATIDVEQQSRTLADIDDLTLSSSPANNSIDIRDETEANIDRRLEGSAVGYDRAGDEDYSDDVGALGTTCLNCEISQNVGNLKGQPENGDVPECSTQLAASPDVACPICWITEYSPTRGVLHCGHRFCFKCIQKWADRSALDRKDVRCPLCNARFDSITRIDDAATLDQKVYSQTIPSPSSTQDIYIVPECGAGRSETEVPLPLVCCRCQGEEPTDSLIQCQACRISCIHNYCLDPLITPWTCTTCRDHRWF